MKENKESKPMPKWLVYTLFILKFVFSLALIYWTIYMTMTSDVGLDDDNAFLSTYQSVDDNFNTISKNNIDFNNKYNLKIIINNETINGLSYEDVFLAQRAISNRKDKKNILNVGDNKFTILIEDKNGNKIENKNVNILVTRSTNHTEDIKLSIQNNEIEKNFKIKGKGYWNITGTVNINEDSGTFYIKTNANLKSN
ncbi:MAG: hypothetical protein U9Q30_02100 [Campylobacterota bacterium]|nr:hypothetical protein [Campylobacterota bacterium]